MIRVVYEALALLMLALGMVMFLVHDTSGVWAGDPAVPLLASVTLAVLALVYCD